MTDQGSLTSILKEYYAEVEPVSDTVIRCLRKYKDQSYQVLFFDHSDDFLSYNLDSFLKQYVSAEYFRNLGDLQWNFYLIFLTDHAVGEEDRRRIEGNADYARKLIISSNELSLWLKRFYLTNRKITANSQSGLADVWKSVLKEAKLDCMFSTQIKVNEGVEKLISGDNYIEKEVRASNRSFQENDINIGQLRYFDPQGFREYPKFIEPFQFEKVNLIDGANGHGKTSLLEAIEFFITGSNSRIGEPTTGINRLTAKFINDNTPRKYKKDAALFRERDRIWYNGMNRQRGSDLASHFNQFNFYNTDAAFRLTANKNQQDIEEAFREIALGDEVNLLKRQFVVYEVRLQAELKARKKLIDEYAGDIEAQERLLTDLRKSDGSEAILIGALYETLKEFQLNLDLRATDLASLDRIKFSLNAIIAEFDSAIKAIEWLDNISLNKLSAEDLRLEILIDKLDKYKTSKSNDEKDLLGLQEALKSNGSLLVILKELSLYVSGAPQIEGITDRIAELREKVGVVRQMEESFRTVEGHIFTLPQVSLIEARRQQQNTIQEKEEAIAKIEKQVIAGKETLSALNEAIAIIKSQGKIYLSLDEQGTHCPLCETDFGVSSARNSAFLNAVRLTEDSTQFGNLLDVKETLVSEKEAVDKQVEALNTIIHILNIAPQSPSAENVNALESLKYIQEVLANLSIDASALSEAESLYKAFEDRELTEIRYNELLAKYRTHFDRDVVDPDFLDITIKELTDEEKKQADSIAKLEKEILEKKSAITKEIELYEHNFSISSIDKLSQRYLQTNHYFKQLKALVLEQFDQDKNIKEVQLELLAVMQQFNDLRSDIDLRKKEGDLSAKARAIINEKSVLLKAANAETVRIETSLKTLENLLKEHNEDEFLQEFLNINKEEIKEIFLAIHTPKEFSDINITEGKVVLNKANGETSDLMHVSTGQRSALALSLFLTLNNKLKNGPPMIIFDDPVAFTDDLNILSFLDYLREIVLDEKSGKQLFFATANENLSFLFQKKFEILGEEFKHFSLIR